MSKMAKKYRNYSLSKSFFDKTTPWISPNTFQINYSSCWKFSLRIIPSLCLFASASWLRAKFSNTCCFYLLMEFIFLPNHRLEVFHPNGNQEHFIYGSSFCIVSSFGLAWFERWLAKNPKWLIRYNWLLSIIPIKIV